VAHFRLACYRFLLKATTEIHLPPYKGSAFRGGFGHALKSTVCMAPEQACPPCAVQTHCLYPYIFDTKLAAHGTDAGGEEAIPRPFVLVPPLEEYQHYPPGSLLTCDLVLLGDALAYGAHFVATMEKLGSIGIGRGKGHFVLTQVQALRPQAPAMEIYPGHEHALSQMPPPVRGEELVLPYQHRSARRLTLTLLTPMRLKYHQRLLNEAPAFHIIIRRLLDRLAEVSLFYHHTPLALDLQTWKRQAEQIRLVASHIISYDWERYSSRQHTRMKLGGMIGTATYAGELAPFLPLLAVGEWLHVGKGTTFGLGKYRMTDIV
jgi:hypothetical protein